MQCICFRNLLFRWEMIFVRFFWIKLDLLDSLGRLRVMGIGIGCRLLLAWFRFVWGGIIMIVFSWRFSCFIKYSIPELVNYKYRFLKIMSNSIIITNLFGVVVNAIPNLYYSTYKTQSTCNSSIQHQTSTHPY